jgi:Tfp pilus assembly protein PilW
MKLRPRQNQPLRTTADGFTLVEMLTSVGLGILLMGVVVILFLDGSMTFVAVGNYQDLDAKSTAALDTFSKEIRNATGLVAYTPNVSLVLTNATAGTLTTLTYNTNAGTLVLTKTGLDVRTNLTGCDFWTFSLYSKAPNPTGTNITFYAATNASSCKLINMTWTCSRKIAGVKLTTESVQTAQVVLRNDVN